VFFHLDDIAAVTTGPAPMETKDASFATAAPPAWVDAPPADAEPWGHRPRGTEDDSTPEATDELDAASFRTADIAEPQGPVDLEEPEPEPGPGVVEAAAEDRAPPPAEEAIGDDDGSLPPARSWSIGESEIVFSLPATLLRRDIVDLATVPWRPLAAPAWSRLPGGVAAASRLQSAPALSGTPTLAQLYLEQGHAEEAGKLFEQVLRREPENEAARAGLDRAQRELGRPSALSLLRGFEPTGSGLSAKQAHVLRRWAALLREAHLRHAP
jgi:hypothetical protein